MADSDTANSLPMGKKDLGWTALPDLEGVYDPRGVAIRDHHFAVGENRRYYSLDISSKTYRRPWADLPYGDVSVSRSGVAVVGDRLYVIGGKSDNGTRLSRVYSVRIQDKDDDSSSAEERTSWHEVAPMQHGRSAFACASDDRFVYVFGGGTELDECSASAEVYDTQTNQWKSLPSMPGGGRAHCSAARVEHRIFVVGGMMHHRSQAGVSLYQFLASTVVYNVLQQAWEPTKECLVNKNDNALGNSVHSKMIPEMSVPRAYHAVVAVDRFVIALGGLFPGAVSSMEVLDTRDNVWDIGPTKMADSMRYTFCAGRLKNNRIVVVGGYKDNRTKSSVETLPFSGILPHSFRNTDIFRFVKNHFCNSSLLHDAKKRKKLTVFGARDADASVAKKPRIQ